jgi:hypothetical protein
MELQDALELWVKYEAQTSKKDAIDLYNAVLNSPSGDVVEVGSASGGTTIMLMAAAEEVGKMVYSIDPYPGNIVATFYSESYLKALKGAFKRNILSGAYKNIIQYNEDTKICIDKIPDGLSVVFIDGCHEFSNVKDEINLLLPKIVTKGFLFIHDIGWVYGQVSKTPETGVRNVGDWVNQFNITNKRITGDMLSAEVVSGFIPTLSTSTSGTSGGGTSGSSGGKGTSGSSRG